MTPLYREDSAHKVRGGLAGRVGQSLSAGGRPMDVLPEYIAGRTPREIAHELNNESFLPPCEPSWNASTINGNMQRDTGIIPRRSQMACGQMSFAFARSLIRWLAP